MSVFTIVWLSVLSPAIALAQETSSEASTSGPAVNANGEPTGAPADTGAPACTGAGCGQGEDQGEDQGSDQGGPSAQELGADENGVLPAGVEDTRQGAGQGSAQGGSNGISGENANTGANSTNAVDVDAAASTTTDIDNTVTDTTAVDAAALTGANKQNKNTSADGVKTGNANIGVTQVKNDNSATIGGTSGLSVSGHNGSHDGDYTIGFGANTGYLTGNGGGSIRAINDTTGSGSTNEVDIETRTEEINEVQNDGIINNLLNLEAITGQNEANKNTSDGSITTGDANIAATLVNLLNTTVINGDLWVSVADIFGDLNGNIVLPEFASLAAAAGAGDLAIDATNDQTGANSENDIDIDVSSEEETNINNEAQIATNVDAAAITGQNEALKNTGGAAIETGDGSVSASNISLANTTIEGGNWGLVVVNALNRWLGFLVGESGEVRALSQDETLREIEAHNSGTGSDSTNDIDIEVEQERLTNVNNDAVINNDVTATAITGQNEANMNTGQGKITTGDANVDVTAINIANTTVKDGSLFIAVVNVFGDWFGDLLYNDSSLASAAAAQGGGEVVVDAENAETGAHSENTIDVDVSRERETHIDNEADITTNLTADIDTGNNRANRNTLGADILTGDGNLALHSRAVANLTGIALDPALGLTVRGINDTTGFDSENTIRANLNDERVIDVNNDANVSTIFGGVANTGDNEANYNTIGGSIVTGAIDANIGIENLINRVILALHSGQFAALAAADDIVIDAELLNTITGALSENSNEVAANYDFLADIINTGVIDNLIDLLLNTGGNTSQGNTLAGDIYSGQICANADVANNANQVTGGGSGSLNLLNLASISNVLGISGESGGNVSAENTGYWAGDHEAGTCGKLAQAPDEPEGEGGGGPGDEPEEPAGKGGGGGDVGPDDEAAVAGAADAGDDYSAVGGGEHGGDRPLLTRFPVAGENGAAIWLPGERASKAWPAFLVLSIALIGLSHHFDRRSRSGRESQLKLPFLR